MTDHDVHGCGRAGTAIGVLCAFLGAVCATLMIFALFKISKISDVAPSLAIGLIGLFVGAGFFGNKAGVFLCEKGNNRRTNVLVGIALAFGSIVIAVLTGALAGALFSGSVTRSEDVIFIGVIVAGAACIYGAVPAILLGVLYGFLMTGELRK